MPTSRASPNKLALTSYLGQKNKEKKTWGAGFS